MFFRLLLLFTVVPLVELALLIELGKRIGVLDTVLIVLLTGFAGAALARREGFEIITRFRTELAQGQLPADSMLDGALVLSGALLLLTPGLITDAFGFFLIIPFTRALCKATVKKYLRRKINSGEIHVNYKVDD